MIGTIQMLAGLGVILGSVNMVLGRDPKGKKPEDPYEYLCNMGSSFACIFLPALAIWLLTGWLMGWQTPESG